MRCAWWLGLLMLGACGGQAAHREAADTALGGATSGGAEGASGAGGATSAPRGCVDASWGECASLFAITLRFDGSSSSTDDGSAWVEPLQLPEIPDPPATEPAPPVDPTDWDRSRLPMGACVFRLHGASPSCLGGQHGSLRAQRCGASRQPVVLFSYYEDSKCSEGIAPGCAGYERYTSANNVWYAVPEPDGTTLLVMCAGTCAYGVLYEGTEMCLVGSPIP